MQTLLNLSFLQRFPSDSFPSWSTMGHKWYNPWPSLDSWPESTDWPARTASRCKRPTCSQTPSLTCSPVSPLMLNALSLYVKFIHIAEVDLFFEEQDKTKQAELMKKMGDETLPKFGTIMEKFLKENGGKYLVGNDLTWADLIVCEAISNIGQWLSSPWKESSPELATYVDRIFSLPKIKKWIETRPKTVS